MIPGAVWTQLECHIGLIVSCFPALNRVPCHLRQLVHGSCESNVAESEFNGGRRVDSETLGGAELYSITAGINLAVPVTESQERMVPEFMGGSELSMTATRSETSMEVVVIEHVQELSHAKLR